MPVYIVTLTKRQRQDAEKNLILWPENDDGVHFEITSCNLSSSNWQYDGGRT